MAKEDLEAKAREAVLRIDKNVSRIKEMLTDLGSKIIYSLEHKDYRTLPYSDSYDSGS